MNITFSLLPGASSHKYFAFFVGMQGNLGKGVINVAFCFLTNVTLLTQWDSTSLYLWDSPVRRDFSSNPKHILLSIMIFQKNVNVHRGEKKWKTLPHPFRGVGRGPTPLFHSNRRAPGGGKSVCTQLRLPKQQKRIHLISNRHPL